MLPIMFSLFFVLMALAVPIAFAMSGSAVVALLYQGQVPLTLVAQRAFAGADSYTLLAIPFFIIAGELMTSSRMTDALVDLCDALLGHLRSGLSFVTILACTIFSGISGSGSADTAAIGAVMTPQLVAKGYPRSMAAAIIASAGALGPIIPPSILMIIYAAIAEQSVARMFLGGIVPGILIAIGLMIVAHLWNLRRNFERGSGIPPSLPRFRRAFINALVPLGAPVVIVVGIAFGVFTPTEAGVVAALYALAAALFYSGTTWAAIREAFLRAGILSSLSVFVICMSMTFAWILAREGFPTLVADSLLWLSGGNNLLAGALVMLVIIVLGFPLETMSLMIIFVPILAPLGPKLGFDAIHWGLLIVFAINIGGITPPVGSNIFIAASIARCDLNRMSIDIMPYVGIHAVAIFLVLFVPEIVLWLPRLVFQ